MVSGATVVTREQPAPDSKEKIKIPDACNEFQASWTDPFSAYRALGLRFITKAWPIGGEMTHLEDRRRRGRSGRLWVTGDDALMTSTPDHVTSPLLEHDPAPRAFIEPSEQVNRRDVPEACVITFFADVVDRLVQSRGARVLVENRWEDGPHPLLEVDHDGDRLAVLHSGVGAPLAGGLLEEVVAMGCRAFVVCGGAGALRPDLTVGHLVVVTSSLRDEGTSHHYLPAGRYIDAHLGARTVLEQVLVERNVPFISGRTWTTDAPYRETPDKIAIRRAEGCLTVEMEASALAAVARFRRVPLTQVVYCGDDLSGETWDHRSWQTRSEVRENLFDLAATAALRLAKATLRQ